MADEATEVMAGDGGARRSRRDAVRRGASASGASGTVENRLGFALRQAALMAVALLLAGSVTARLRPEDAVERQISSASYLWAIVIWAAVLLFNAVAFERSQMRRLEGLPLIGGGIAGAVVFVIGLVGVDTDSAVGRVVYSLANALGAAMFWWAMLSLGLLVIVRMSTERNRL